VSILTVGDLLGLMPATYYLVVAYFIFLTSKGLKEKNLKMFGDVLGWVLIILSVITMFFGTYLTLKCYKTGVRSCPPTMMMGR